MTEIAVKLPHSEKPTVPVRWFPKRTSAPVNIRHLLEAAIEDALPSLRADAQVRKLALKLQEMRSFDDDPDEGGQTAIMREIDEVMSYIVMHCLKRQKMTRMRVSVEGNVRNGAIFALVILQTGRREARRDMEIQL